MRDRVIAGEAERRQGPLLQSLRQIIRERHYALTTERTYLEWVWDCPDFLYTLWDAWVEV